MNTKVNTNRMFALCKRVLTRHTDPTFTVYVPGKGTVAVCRTPDEANRAMSRYHDAMLMDADGICLSR